MSKGIRSGRVGTKKGIKDSHIINNAYKKSKSKIMGTYSAGGQLNKKLAKAKENS